MERKTEGVQLKARAEEAVDMACKETGEYCQ